MVVNHVVTQGKGNEWMKVHVEEENARRLRLAFLVRRRADPDADFSEFAESVVNRLISETPVTELLPRKTRT